MTVVLTTTYARAPLGRAVPGSEYDGDLKAWVLPEPTPRSAAVALKLLPELALEYPELAVARDKLAQDVRPFDNATPYGVEINAATVRDQLRAAALDLYKFQSLDLGYVADVLRTHGGAYIGWERGLGKTLAGCALVDDLDATRTLVVCPNTAKESVWAAELERWLPEHLIHVLPNTKAKREQMLNRWRLGRNNTRDGVPVKDVPSVLVIHYEALPIIAGRTKVKGKTRLGQGWEKLGTWDLVIADEVHRIKNTDAQFTRALKKVPATYKVGLSGSIIQNHAEELFSVLQWLFPDTYRRKWADWNDRYLDYVEGSYGKICIGVKLDKLKDLRDELGVFMVYRRKEDELDLPPLTEQTLFVDISSSQRKVYDELVRSCLAELPDGTRIKAQEGLVLLGKLRQVATGLDLLGEVEDSAKLDVAHDLITDSDEGWVVFTWFKAAGRSLAERLESSGVPSYIIDGDTKAPDRASYIDAFTRGERRVMIGTLSTMSESINLQETANNVLFLDRSWNPATNIQARDRVYRNGQTRPVTVVDLVARDTVDELRVTPTIANKEALRRLIFGGK